MGLEHLSDSDKTTLGQALRAAADGPFFPEWEFHTLFGLTRTEVRALADAWPTIDLTNPNIELAASTALNNLLGYPHGQDSAWFQWISVERRELDELLGRLQGSGNKSYFERLR